jgi:hypothetical protein
MAYANGEIPLSALVRLPGYSDQYLYAEPARQFIGLADAFYAERKNSLVSVEAYRPRRKTPGLPGSAEGYFFSRYSRVGYKTGLWYDGSWWKRNPGALAAGIPGTSHHGFARAVDVDIYSFSSADYNALTRLAPQYGFSLVQGIADGEPWHIVYVGSPRIVAAGLGTTNIDNDGNDMADITQGQVQWIANTLLDTGIKTPVGDRTVKQALADALLFGQANANEIAEVKAGLAGTPGAVWAVRLEHTVAKDAEGKPLSIPAGDLLRYEPAEHEGTRRAVAAVARPDVDLDYTAVVAELKASGLDPATYATYAADEADRRERERLAS